MTNHTFDQKIVSKDINKVIRLMDYVITRLNSKRIKSKDAKALADIYQMLGMAWHYFGLQCSHHKGYRRIKDGHQACRVCGKIKGTRETEKLSREAYSE